MTKVNSPLKFISLFLTHKREKWPDWIESSYGPKPAERISDNRVVYTFINHATVLIQTAGLNILTDPIWSNRCSPFSWVGPRRHRNAGIQFSDLPPIDVVLISHNHYDHMDLPTIRKLAKDFGPRILVGSGNQEYLERKGFQRVEEFSWWQDRQLSEHVRATFVPAKHFSGRGLFDRNRTLWGGFVIETPDTTIYFAGDTAYSAHFQEIYRRFGPADLSFLPIGAYKPRSFMCSVHMDPADAVKAHIDLKSAQSVGIHFGTFNLAFEGIDRPVKDLDEARKNCAIDPEKFIVPQFGEQSVKTIKPQRHKVF